ncbi:Uncharacterized protein conserved in bacteria (DUF2313) [Escherichia coli]|uniref:Uncharacterized protein conserved in bacteria (DUF2313) n=1 Tax=Escherichia coli TaxID=562 RepID=A0A376P5Z3_ECOLX|nr:Uncharacterized protein conserved in bacteria (DUF2313) [Escherichia coli]
MAVTPYQTAFLQLLPSGLAWNKSPDSKLSALAQAISDVIATAADDARQILRERFPSTSAGIWVSGNHFWGCRTVQAKTAPCPNASGLPRIKCV